MRESRLAAVLAAGQRHLATTGDNEASQAAAGLGTALENEFDARDGKIADLEERLTEVASAKERLEEQGDKIEGLEERLAEVALAKERLEERMANLFEKLLARVELLESEKRSRQS
jgi:uncharacterized coiled-coil protein SlyX